MAKSRQQTERIQGRDNRLREIRRIINHPEQLDDITVDMLYAILYNQ